MGCCNNAANAVGEFAIVYGEQFQKYIPDFAQKIVETFNGSPKVIFVFFCSFQA